MYDRRTTELTLPAKKEGDRNIQTKKEFVALGDSVSDLVATLDRKLASISGPINYSYSMRSVITEAQLMSLRMDAENDKLTDRNQRYQERYRRSVVLLSKVAIQMRMSEMLSVQDSADQLERWIVNELLKPDRKELFSDEEYSSMTAALADKTGRHNARRRAVVIAWYGHCEGKQDFGGYELPTLPAVSMASSWLVAERNVGQATAALLDYLEAEPHYADRFPAKVQSFWPNGSAEAQRQFSLYDVLQPYLERTPGALWHQEWEIKAAQLNESTK